MLLSLWRDLYTLQQSALATEAGIAGMNMSLSAGTGLTMRVGGFTDKQSMLLEKALAGLVVNVDEQGFAQAVDRYVRALQNQGKQFPFYQAFGAYNKLIREGSFNTEQLIKTAQELTPADLTNERVFTSEPHAFSPLVTTIKQHWKTSSVPLPMRYQRSVITLPIAAQHSGVPK